MRGRDRIRYQEKEKERRLDYAREYYSDNREKLLKKEAGYYKANKEKVKLRVGKWNSENPDKVRAQSRIKRARKLNAYGSHTLKEFYEVCESFNWECAYCGCSIKQRTATEDHVVPLIKGGTDLIQNIVPACRSCNSSKQEKDFLEWYTNQDFYSKNREERIINSITNGNPQLALF